MPLSHPATQSSVGWFLFGHEPSFSALNARLYGALAFQRLTGKIVRMSTVWTPLDRIQSKPLVVAVPVRVREMAAALLILALLGAGWYLTATPLTVTVDGTAEGVRTHRRTVAPLLADLGLTVHEQDRLSVDPGSRLTDGLEIRVDRAHPVRILADGRDLVVFSFGETPTELLADAGIGVDSYDQVVVDGRPARLDAPLAFPEVIAARPTFDRGRAWANLDRAEPVQLRIYRAIPITVDDGDLPFVIRTTAQTVGEALREAEIVLYLGDRVQPSLGSPVSTGLRVFIQRSIPIAVQVDGQTMKTRTQGESVADALTEMGIGVAGLDRVEPPLESKLYDNTEIRIVRVQEEVEVLQDIVPFETIFVPDANILIDTQQLVNPGAEGITRHRYRVRYEDGQEAERVLEDSWIAQEPAQRVIAYGQNIVPRTVNGPNGETITYWRYIKMYATSYSAGTAGVSPDSPWYGLTRTGEPMRDGVVAVDPKIIPLRTQLFIPSYGYGDALDTGSAIRARRIDLGYSDANLVLRRGWVDVYLLWPPPPSYQITWVIPNYPVLPR